MRGKEDEVLAPKAKRNVDQLYAIEAMVNVLASRSNAIGAAANPSHAGPFSEAPSSIQRPPLLYGTRRVPFLTYGLRTELIATSSGKSMNDSRPTLGETPRQPCHVASAAERPSRCCYHGKRLARFRSLGRRAAELKQERR